MFEKAYALRSPVMEAEYAFDDRTAISFYDCLIPRLREHVKFRIRPEIYTHKNLLYDLKAKQRAV